MYPRINTSSFQHEHISLKAIVRVKYISKCLSFFRSFFLSFFLSFQHEHFILKANIRLKYISKYFLSFFSLKQWYNNGIIRRGRLDYEYGAEVTRDRGD